MIISIFSVDINHGIGVSDKLALPWDVKEDMQFFRKTTENCIVIMGRKTFESIGRPLKNRINIVIQSDQPVDTYPNLYYYKCIDDALQFAKDIRPHGHIFIIGGLQLYNSTFHICDLLYVNYIKEDHKTDVIIKIPDYYEKVYEYNISDRVVSSVWRNKKIGL